MSKVAIKCERCGGNGTAQFHAPSKRLTHHSFRVCYGCSGTGTEKAPRAKVEAMAATADEQAAFHLGEAIKAWNGAAKWGNRSSAKADRRETARDTYQTWAARAATLHAALAA